MKCFRSAKPCSFFNALRLATAIAFTITLVAPPPLYAQNILNLPNPGAMVPLSPSFTPTILRGIEIDLQNPFKFEFIVDRGDQELSQEELKAESEKVIRYFLAGLALPEDKLWVNLSPYENDRIVDDTFGQTEMGRDLLAQDYMLKQITASLIYPEDDFGRAFWQKIYKKAYEKFQTTNIPINTFNKVWIVPDKATVYAQDSKALVIESTMNVMLEQDYLSLEKNLFNDQLGTQKQKENTTKDVSAISSQVVREVVLPELLKEVNEGKNFAQLRQIYNSLILANWFKANLKQAVLNKVYSDQGKVGGISTEDKEITKKIYDQYLAAFKKGVCDFMKIEYDPYMKKQVPRKYFSGGCNFKGASPLIVTGAQGEQRAGSAIQSWTLRAKDRLFGVYTFMGEKTSTTLNKMAAAVTPERIRNSALAKVLPLIVAASTYTSALMAHTNSSSGEIASQMNVPGHAIAVGESGSPDNTYDASDDIVPSDKRSLDGGDGLVEEKKILEKISGGNGKQIGRFSYDLNLTKYHGDRFLDCFNVSLKKEGLGTLGSLEIFHDQRNDFLSMKLSYAALNVQNKVFSDEKDFEKARKALLLDDLAMQDFFYKVDELLTAPQFSERGLRIDPGDIMKIHERIENGIFPTQRNNRDLLKDSGDLNDAKPIPLSILNATGQRVAIALFQVNIDPGFKKPASFQIKILTPGSSGKVRVAPNLEVVNGYTAKDILGSMRYSGWITVSGDLGSNSQFSKAVESLAPVLRTGNTFKDRVLMNFVRTTSNVAAGENQGSLNLIVQALVNGSRSVAPALGSQQGSTGIFQIQDTGDTVSVAIQNPTFGSWANEASVATPSQNVDVTFDPPAKVVTTKVIGLDLSVSMTSEKITELETGLEMLMQNFDPEETLKIYLVNEIQKKTPIETKVKDLTAGLQDGSFLRSLQRTPTTHIIPQLKYILEDAGDQPTEVFLISDFLYSITNTNENVPDSVTQEEFSKTIVPLLKSSVKFYAHHVPDANVQDPILTGLMQEHPDNFSVETGNYSNLMDTWKKNHPTPQPSAVKVAVPSVENPVIGLASNGQVVAAIGEDGQAVPLSHAQGLLDQKDPVAQEIIIQDSLTGKIAVPYVPGAAKASVKFLGKKATAPFVGQAKAEKEVLIIDVSGSMAGFEGDIKEMLLAYIDSRDVLGICFFSGTRGFQSFIGLSKEDLKEKIRNASFGGATDVANGFEKTVQAIYAHDPNVIANFKIVSDLATTEGNDLIDLSSVGPILRQWLGRSQFEFFIPTTNPASYNRIYGNPSALENYFASTSSSDEDILSRGIRRWNDVVAFTEAFRTKDGRQLVHTSANIAQALLASLYSNMSSDVLTEGLQQYDEVEIQYFDDGGNVIDTKVLKIEPGEIFDPEAAAKKITSDVKSDMGANSWKTPGKGNKYFENAMKRMIEKQNSSGLAALTQEAIDTLEETEVLASAVSSPTNTTQPEYGGIDFKTDQFDLKTKGEGIDMNIPFDENMLQDFNPDTVAPIIIQIVPIANPQMILGLSGSSSQTPS